MNKFYSWILTGFIGLSCPLPAIAERHVDVQRFADIAEAKTLSFPASVINLQLAGIAAETGARITGFEIEVGDVIEQGTVLVELDCRAALINRSRIKAAIKQLIARRKLTRQQLERATRLSSSSSISREELDQRQTQLDADNASIEEQEANLKAAQLNLEHCQIKAPFSGMVVEKMSSTGSYATPGVTLLKLLKLDAVEIHLELPGTQIEVLKQAQTLSFETNGTHYPLKLRSVLPLVNSNSLQQIVRLTIHSTSMPAGGSFGLVKFNTPKHFLPASYVQKRNGLFGVFIVDGTMAQFKVLPDAEEAQAVATRLSPDSLIISSDLQLLTDQEIITFQH